MRPLLRLLLTTALLLPLAARAEDAETRRLRAQVQSLQAQVKALQAKCPTASVAPAPAAGPVTAITPAATPTAPAMAPALPLPSPAAAPAPQTATAPAAIPAGGAIAAGAMPAPPARPVAADTAVPPPTPPPGYKLVKIDPKAAPELPHDERFRSQANWESLFRGMSETEVEDLLGIEHRTLTRNGRTLWSYGVPGVSPVGRVIFIDGKVTVWELPNF